MCSKCGFTWIYLLNLLIWILILHFTYSADDTNPSFPYGFPHITEHPQDDYFAKNNPATLNCKAEGDPRPKITWYKDGKPVETNRDDPLSHRMLLDNGQLFFLRVIHSKNNHPDIGEYYCNATNKHGTAISRVANIQIAVLRDDFRQEPMDTTTAVGQTVVLHCRPPRGKPDPKVIWRKDGESVQPDERIQIQEDGDLVITSVVKGDVGEYLCLAINTGGEKQSNPAQLRVLDVPVFHKLPKDVTTEEGKTVEFYCDVMGDPPIKVQWSKEDGSVSFGRARIMSDHTLRIENVESSDEGVYICSAENAAGSTQATARLTVFSSPSFLIRPRDQLVAVGRTVTLQCVAAGNPPPTVFWSKESQESLMFPNRDEGRYSVSEDGTFRIADVTYDDAGVYKCEALNIRGQASASATVEVRAEGDFGLPAHDPRAPPIIKIGPHNQTLPVDGVALLRCQAEGDPDPIIRWYRNGRPLLMTDPRLTKLDSGTLQISDLKTSDTGIYTCKAVSEAGETTWDSFLKIEVDVGQNFFRIPSVASLPDPPTKPLVSEVTDTSVHLSWAPGTQIGASAVFAFEVEYFGYGTTDGWVVASDSVKRESYTVENLKPNTTYIFLVRARNAEGMGLPSLVSNRVRTAAPGTQFPRTNIPKSELEQRLEGKVVEIVMAKSVNSTAISVSWKVLKGQDIIEGFYIHYQHIIDIRRLQYGMSYQLPVSDKVTSYTIAELSPYNWYEICVMAYSRDVQSKCSSPIKVQTEEEVLIREPANIVIHKDSSTSMTVLWSPPIVPTRDIKIEGYMLRCLSEDEKHNCSLTTKAEAVSASVKKLRQDQKYRIQLAALTTGGYGKWSKVYIVGDKVSVSDDDSFESTTKQLAEAESEPSELMKKPWFIGVMIGTVGGMLWLILCILTVWLCKRRKNKKKMKDQRYYTGVPLHKDNTSKNLMYPPQYGTKDPSGLSANDLDLPAEFRVLLPQQKKEQEINEENLYKVAGGMAFPEMKTFYQKVDPVAPYATTSIIQQQQQNLLKQRGLDHMFRPINQGYIQHSEGSGDSYHKPELSTDSNNSRPENDHHDHSDNMQSPVSDSGSHTTDENGLLIKQRKKHNVKKNLQNKPVNLSEFLPPPPEHPPPSECGEPPSYQEVRGDAHDASRSPQSPLSPVSFSQVSACSCPNPHTQTPVSGWNMPVYSDNECPRCHSEKYFDPAIIPGVYPQNPYVVQQTPSPRTIMLQNLNNRNIQNCSHSQSPCVTPNINYQYAQPPRITPSVNYSASQKGPSNPSRSSHSSHSDIEGNLPCFQSYRIMPQTEKDGITQSEKDYRPSSSEKDYRLANSEKDYRLGREPKWAPSPDYRFISENEWGPGPAPPCRHCEHDSGTGLEEEDGGCMDRACQSSLPNLANDCINNSLYPARPSMSSKVYNRGDSPTSEGADYAADSDLDNPAEQRDGNTDQCNSDSSSVHSSSGSSGEGAFLTEADFASAVARAAEMSGLTVVGTTVCDLNNKAKKEKRHRRAARPVSPGYSTDSNYGSIDIVHKPYPKSERKKQLLEQGKPRGKDIQRDLAEEQPNSKDNSSSGVYDMPYSKPSISSTAPRSPMVPQRVSSLSRAMAPPGGQTESESGKYASFLPQLISQPLREDVV